MQAFFIVIKPRAAFRSELTSDRLFGQFIWELTESKYQNEMETLLNDYETNPRLIVSGAFPWEKKYERWLLPKPILPSYYFFSEKEAPNTDRKEWKAKNQVELRKGGITWGLGDRKIFHSSKSITTKQKRIHVSISRITNTTGSGDNFAPYEAEDLYFSEEMELGFLVLTDLFQLNALKELFTNMGLSGYGKDASIGKGQFSIVSIVPWKWQDWIPKDSNAYLTLGHSVPVLTEEECNAFYSETETRFGRLGRSFSSISNPFKNPILFSKPGAVLLQKENIKDHKKYIGKGLRSVAKIASVVSQGYAPLLPLRIPTL